jgi:hypothetical protein
MEQPGIGRDPKLLFLEALARTGNSAIAATEASVDHDGMLALRKTNREFAAEWRTAERWFEEGLDHELFERAMIGFQDPVVSGGELLRDQTGRPVAVNRRSDQLLLALLRARRPDKYALIVRPSLPPWCRWLAILFVVAFTLWVCSDIGLRLESMR